MMTTLKKKIQNLLKSITEQNQKQFGTGKMDCCEMNKKPIIKK